MMVTTMALVVVLAGGLVHPELASQTPPQAAIAEPPPPPEKPAPRDPGTNPRTGAPMKGGLTVEDYAYEMPEGVTAREVIYYSDGIACYAKLFFPPGFDPQEAEGRAAVVLGQGYAGTHHSIEKYGARFAASGLVAMVIDYRGWGGSMGYPRIVEPVTVGGPLSRDDTRHEVVEAKVWLKRTRLLPQHQQTDYRNAISYIQGEPGVDPERIGVWGSSLAGANALAVAGQDARVKVIAVQVPGIGGNPDGTPPTELKGPLLQDAIAEARTGQGAEVWSGYSRLRLHDAETYRAMRENNTLQWAKNIGTRPFMVIVAEHEELIDNEKAGKAALAFAKGPTEYVVVQDTTHFEIYTGEAFETSVGAAARWFTTHLAR
ncbi:MAG: acetylxylan esterase [Alphaproteobacteria bacterium]|nr:acetylxylan esterase [Alphaproteobacteria bacterium]